MRIAQVSTLSAPVNRGTNGSVESLVWLLSRELTALGHEVSVYGAGNSDTETNLVATLPGPYGAPGSFDDWQLCEWLNLCRAVAESKQYDVLHSHAYLWGMPLEPFSHAPMLHTLHIVPDASAAQLWSMHPQARVSAVSHHQWSSFPTQQPISVIHHGVDVREFSFCPQPEDYLLFMGRFVSGKGPLHAIKAARELGKTLIMAGPANAYFREKIASLVDGRSIVYAGFVAGEERSRLLGGARALLYPIQYPESFGLVLVEAMLCGTPVAAVRLGAVPELVAEGITGFTVPETANLPAATSRCFSLDRAEIRRWAEQRFSARRMAEDYLRLYQQLHA